MSERLTDEQVAWYAGTSRTAKWTADMAVHENIITLAREVQGYRALRPTCPTCFGSGVDAKYPHRESTACPDCTDGTMPLDKWMDRLLAQCVRQRALLDDLRACSIALIDDYSTALVRVKRTTWDALHALGGES